MLHLAERAYLHVYAMPRLLRMPEEVCGSRQGARPSWAAVYRVYASAPLRACPCTALAHSDWENLGIHMLIAGRREMGHILLNDTAFGAGASSTAYMYTVV